MNIFSCFMDGIRRVNSAKRYIFVVYLINVLLALGLAISLGGAIKDSLGSSMAAERLRDGFDGFWDSNFSAQARGLNSVTAVRALRVFHATVQRDP